MIKVTRLNSTEFYVNPELIEFIEETPNTVITLTTGKKIIVTESADDIILAISDYKRSIFFGLPEARKQDYEVN